MIVKSFPKQRGYHQLVNILLQTATDAGVQADGNAVEKIMEIMDEIVESLYEVQKRELEADDAKEAAFITQK